MRIIMVLFVFMGMSMGAFAQSDTSLYKPARKVSYIDGIRVKETAEVIFIGTYIIQYFDCRKPFTGIYTFSSKQLMRLPQHNINAVAGLIAGVDSRNGQIPNIKGARQDGTAYYVDGVRTYFLNTVF